MAKEAAVHVKHKNHKGEEVIRTFTPESVNPENPHHEGKSHVDLANEFVESNADKGARIVKSAPVAAKKKAAPVDEEESVDEETAEESEEAVGTDAEETEEAEARPAGAGAKKRK